MRAAMNAVLYLLRTGPWRYPPRDSFPPRSTVHNIFRKFHRDGVWEAIWADLHMASGERMGRVISPSAAVLDSQSIKSAGNDNQVGYDAGNEVKARKIHTLVYSRAADAGRCPLRRDSRPRRGGFGSRQDKPPLPLAAPGDRQAARR
jgi:transposase